MFQRVAAVLVLLAPLAALAILLLLGPAEFPTLEVALALLVVELVLVVGAVLFGRSPGVAVPADLRQSSSQHDPAPPSQSDGGVKQEPAMDDQLPFRRAWWAFDLGRYRPCDGTYCYYPYDTLPPLDQSGGTLNWLGPLDEGTDRQVEIHRNAPEERGALGAIQAEAASLHLTLPPSFVSLMGSPELQDRIPSCTACYFKLSDHIVPCIGAEDGYIARFLNDQQDVLLWFLFLAPSGEQRVLVSSAPLDELAREYPNGVTESDKKVLIGNTYVCAQSFDEFIYRWWLENSIWFALDTGDGGKLTEAQRRYVEFYEQQGANPAN